jgi:hypothetical protein
MRTALAFVLVSLSLVSFASAQITNGSFDAGLTGWAPSVNGFGQISPHSFGNPINSALITTTNSIFVAPVGSGTLTQQFGCGSSFDPGVCVVSLDYIVFMFGNPTITFEVVIDGNSVYQLNHSTPTIGWLNVTAQVPCGLHNIAIAASFQAGTDFNTWSVHIDNVTATCQSIVPTEPSTWGRVKALYRQ